MPTRGPQPIPQLRSHLPLQQLLRPHVLGEELLPRAVAGQRAVAQVVFQEGAEWNQGWRDKGMPSPQPPDLYPSPPVLVPLTPPTCQGRGVQSWQHLVLPGRGERLGTRKEPSQRLAKWQQEGWPCPVPIPTPSYLGILNKEARAMAIGALGALPAASTADAAYTALTAHAIPVTCCRGRSKGVRAPVGPVNS